MKRCFKSVTVAGLFLAIILSLSLTVEGTEIIYSQTKNSGQRDVTCTTLEGTGALTYYTQSTTFEVLSEKTQSEVLAELRSLMTGTHTYKSTYNNSRDYADETDCQNGDGKIILLYTSCVVEASDFIGSGSIGWNREHVWPKSLGGFDNDGAGADLHHIRPDDVTTNAKRGNLKYGNVNDGSQANGSSLVGGMSGGAYSGTYFEPLDNVKGDVARICLYVYVRYGSEYSKCSSITNVFESVDVLLEWCADDPVDTWEMGRNEVVSQIQGNRNVFIDYPEYAWLLFGKELPEGMITPSGLAANKTPETTLPDTTDVSDTTIVTQQTTDDPAQSSDVTSVTDSREEPGCASSISSGVIALILLPAAAVIRKRRI